MANITQEWKIRYRSTSLLWRSISWGVMLIVVAALTYNFHWEYFITIPLTVGVIAYVEILAFRPYLLSAGLATVLFLFTSLTFISTFAQSMVPFYEAGQLAYIETLMLAGMVISTILMLVANWYIANGRYWVNLTVSYALYLLGITLIPLAGVNPIYITALALIPVALWVLVRKLWLFKKDPVVDKTALKKLTLTEISEQAYKEDLDHRFSKSHTMKEDLVTVIYNKRNVFLILPISPNDEVELTSRGIEMDGNDVTFVIGHITKKLSIISKATKVSGRKFFPIVYITNDKMERGITPVSYKSKSKPDVVEGTVYFTNKKDLSRMLLEVAKNAPAMTEKEKRRYETAFPTSLEKEAGNEEPNETKD